MYESTGLGSAAGAASPALLAISAGPLTASTMGSTALPDAPERPPRGPLNPKPNDRREKATQRRRWGAHIIQQSALALTQSLKPVHMQRPHVAAWTVLQCRFPRTRAPLCRARQALATPAATLPRALLPPCRPEPVAIIGQHPELQLQVRFPPVLVHP